MTKQKRDITSIQISWVSLEKLKRKARKGESYEDYLKRRGVI